MKPRRHGIEPNREINPSLIMFLSGFFFLMGLWLVQEVVR